MHTLDIMLTFNAYTWLPRANLEAAKTERKSLRKKKKGLCIYRRRRFAVSLDAIVRAYYRLLCLSFVVVFFFILSKSRIPSFSRRASLKLAAAKKVSDGVQGPRIYTRLFIVAGPLSLSLSLADHAAVLTGCWNTWTNYRGNWNPPFLATHELYLLLGFWKKSERERLLLFALKSFIHYNALNDTYKPFFFFLFFGFFSFEEYICRLYYMYTRLSGKGRVN